MSSNYRSGTVGVPFQLRYSTEQPLTGLFVQATIYTSSDTLYATVNLSYSVNAGGRYVATTTINIEGDYEVLYTPYTDAGHTVVSEIAPYTTEDVVIRITQDVYGGAGLPPMVPSITEQDLNYIIKEILKGMNYQNPWDYEMTNGRTAEEELLAKSEFNVKSDTVKTIPIKISFEEIKEEIRNSLIDVDKELGSLSYELRLLSGNVKETKKLDLQKIAGLLDKNSGALAVKFEDITKKISAVSASLNSLNKKELDSVSASLKKISLTVEKDTSKPVADLQKEIRNISKQISEKEQGMKVETLLPILKEHQDSFADFSVGLEEVQTLISDQDQLQLGRFNALFTEMNTFFEGIKKVLIAQNKKILEIKEMIPEYEEV